MSRGNRTVARKSIFIKAIEKKSQRGPEQLGRGGQEPVFCRSLQSDFTNEMDHAIKPDEPEATASMPMLPEPAVPGGFTLVIDHFISEMADCMQRQKTGSRPPLPSCSGPRWLSFSMALIKIDFRATVAP